MPAGTQGRQRGFGDVRREREAQDFAREQQRIADRATTRDAADATLAMTSDERVEITRQLERVACDYLRRIGVGAEFQSARLTEFMDDTNQRPAMFQPRSIGGLILRMRRAGLIEATGEVRTNAGVRTTNSNGSPRAVWRVVRVPDGDEL